MMTIWRICSRRWAATAFSGQGAAEYPGRWNSAGVRIVYCGQTRSLTALEVLAHAEDKRLLANADFVVIPVTLPEELVLLPARWPKGWDQMPAAAMSKDFGDRFVAAGKSAVVQVPSVIVRGEFNFLLNPLHADFTKIKIGAPESFRFDGRLLAGGPEPVVAKKPNDS